MTQYQTPDYSQNTDYKLIFELLNFYRGKYLSLLKEGSSTEELSFYQKAIQHYLSLISLIKNTLPQTSHSESSIRTSFFRRLVDFIKHKPKPVEWQTV